MCWSLKQTRGAELDGAISVPGFVQERSPRLVKAEVSGLNRGSSISGDLWSPFLNKWGWIGNFWELELGMIRKVCTLSAYLCEKGWRTSRDSRATKGIWESFLSSTYTHLGFPGIGTLLASVDAAEMFDINIISSVCLSWAEAVFENQPDPRENSLFIGMGRRSCGKSPHQINPYWCNHKKKKTLWRLAALNANQTHPWSAWLAIFVCDGVAMWLKTVLKAVFSIDPHQLKALRAELGWSILLCTCLLSEGKSICCSGFFPQMINLRKNHSPVVLY